MLLPTIVSRCCHVRFQPLRDEVVAELLTKDGLSPERAKEVARLSAGSLDRARWLSEDDRVANWKKIIDGLMELNRLPILDFFPMIAEWAKNREEVAHHLECIRLWVRDLILFRLTGTHHLAFELDGGTAAAIHNVPPERVFLLYHYIEQAVENLKVNANLQLNLEGVCLAIKDSLYGKGDWDSLSKGRQDLPL